MSPAPVSATARHLLDRVRALLPDQAVREIRMFGAVAVMVDDSMAIAVHKDGSLLVRVDPAEDAHLLKNPHATRAEMGAGRSMGPGWINVDAEALRNEQDLSHWVDCATRFLAHRN
jgi:TfoX/Sxy family transcriptional regulator of competence genes